MYVIFEFEFFVPFFAQVRWIDRCLNNRPIDADNNTEARRARRGRFGRADTALTTFTSFPLWDLRRYIFRLQTVQVVGWWGGGLDECTARLRATPSVQRWSRIVALVQCSTMLQSTASDASSCCEWLAWASVAEGSLVCTRWTDTSPASPCVASLATSAWQVEAAASALWPWWIMKW